MNVDEKVEYSIKWFESLGPNRQRDALRELFDYAIQTDWINVWSKEDIEDAVADGEDEERYKAPYIRTCGEPLA